MRIERHEYVDWEPLVVRIISKRHLSNEERRYLEEFISLWIQNNCNLKTEHSWDQESQTASFEPFTEELLQSLASSLDSRFEFLSHLKIGFNLEGTSDCSGLIWEILENTSVSNFETAVSRFQISAGQYFEFMDATDYVPTWDQVCGSKRGLRNFISSNFGSLSVPISGVSWHDATEFAIWARVRLPSETEYENLYRQLSVKQIRSLFDGECWSSTCTANGAILCNEHSKTVLPLTHYDFPFPSFRVAIERLRDARSER